MTQEYDSPTQAEDMCPSLLREKSNDSHGGNLDAARGEFGTPPAGWMDLSTGISPWSYPAEGLPSKVWQELPGNDLALREAASRYYRVPANWVLPVPGSQYALSRIPQLIPRGRVALPQVGYREHQNAWLRAGHQGVFYRNAAHLQQLLEQGAVEHLVLISPNNPTTEKVSRAELDRLARIQGGRGLFLMDEAFADVEDAPSGGALMEHHKNLWVLRSLGKFFGLAGLRLGFLIGQDGPFKLAQPLAETLTPWGINHPAQWLGECALQDTAWQSMQRSRIQETSERLTQLWLEMGAGRWSVHNGGLFVTLRGPYEPLYALYQQLGQRGIYLRWCHWLQKTEQGLKPWLRCGLPADGGKRLRQTLLACSPPNASQNPEPPKFC